MTPESVFAIANLVPLPGWLLLVVVPRNRVAMLVAGTAIPVLLAVLYVGILATHWGMQADSFSTLGGVSRLFSDPWVLLAGWVHYLAFDLFVGARMARDAVERGVPRWLVVPCLVLTLMFGPAGFLAYSIARTRSGTRRPSPDLESPRL